MEFNDGSETSPSRAADGPRRLVDRFRDDPQARRPDPAFAHIRGYWEALRNGRPVPMRGEINPRGLEAALDRAFMLERVAEGVARVRLAGAHATALMGMEVRGMPLSALIAPDSRDALARALASVFDGPCVADFMLDARRSLGRPPLSGRMLVLPLMSEGGEIDRAIGCLSAEGAIGRPPRRFDIAMTRLTRLSAGATPDREAPAAFSLAPREADQGRAQIAGFAEPGAGYDAQAPRPSRTERPHLRLVKTDRAD